MKRFSILSASVLALSLVAPLHADIHHFGYATETGVLPAGQSEIEVWNTARIGKSDYYYGLDQRLEFETGLTDRLQGSLYLNWNKTTAADSNDSLSSSFDWQGLSTEFKYKFSDPSADALGFALYTELGFNTDQMELELKALFDKNVGSWIFAANLIGEGEFANRDLGLTEIELQPVIAAAYQVTPAFTAGLELRNHNDLEKNEETNDKLKWMNSALYLGPTVSYTTKAITVTFTALPQLPALKTEAGSNSVLEFNDHEALELRLHLSIHF